MSSGKQFFSVNIVINIYTSDSLSAAVKIICCYVFFAMSNIQMNVYNSQSWTGISQFTIYIIYYYSKQNHKCTLSSPVIKTITLPSFEISILIAESGWYSHRDRKKFILAALKIFTNNLCGIQEMNNRWFDETLRRSKLYKLIETHWNFYKKFSANI